MRAILIATLCLVLSATASVAKERNVYVWEEGKGGLVRMSESEFKKSSIDPEHVATQREVNYVIESRMVEISLYYNYGAITRGEVDELIHLWCNTPKDADYVYKVANEALTQGKRDKIRKIDEKIQKKAEQYKELLKKVDNKRTGKRPELSREEREKLDVVWTIVMLNKEGIINEDKSDWLSRIAMWSWGDGISYCVVGVESGVITRDEADRIKNFLEKI